MVRVPGWERLGWLRHGFSTRSGGVSTVYNSNDKDQTAAVSLNLGWTKEDDPALVAVNRRLLAEAVGAGDAFARMITLRQVHGNGIHVVREGDGVFETAEGQALLEGDGLMTDRAGVLLAIQTADCVPVMVIDPERRALAVFHAGWRGTVAEIVAAGVSRMAAEFGSRAEQLVAAVGPSIGACCYTVGDEVRTAFAERFPYTDSLFAGDLPSDRLDLWEANRRQLAGAGVLPENITVIGECTGCARDAAGKRKYFSHRIDRGVTGRMMSLAGIAAS